MENVIRKIREAAAGPYENSRPYPHTIWKHAQCVALHAKKFALHLGANLFVAEAGGLLHDIGAAMFGRQDHHVTGVREASLVLISCGCPLELIGHVLHTIHAHRGSQNIPRETLEAECVAAGDAMDHAQSVSALWIAQIGLGFNNHYARERILEELTTDLQKTHPNLLHFLTEVQETAKQELEDIFMGRIVPRRRDLMRESA